MNRRIALMFAGLMLVLVAASACADEFDTDQLEHQTDDTIRSACNGYLIDMVPDFLSSLKHWLDRNSPMCAEIRRAETDADVDAIVKRYQQEDTTPTPPPADVPTEENPFAESERIEKQYQKECRKDPTCVELRELADARGRPVSQADFDKIEASCPPRAETLTARNGCLRHFFYQWPKGTIPDPSVQPPATGTPGEKQVSGEEAKEKATTSTVAGVTGEAASKQSAKEEHTSSGVGSESGPAGAPSGGSDSAEPNSLDVMLGGVSPTPSPSQTTGISGRNSEGDETNSMDTILDDMFGGGNSRQAQQAPSNSMDALLADANQELDARRAEQAREKAEADRKARLAELKAKREKAEQEIAAEQHRVAEQMRKEAEEEQARQEEEQRQQGLHRALFGLALGTAVGSAAHLDAPAKIKLAAKYMQAVYNDDPAAMEAATQEISDDYIERRREQVEQMRQAEAVLNGGDVGGGSRQNEPVENGSLASNSVSMSGSTDGSSGSSPPEMPSGCNGYTLSNYKSGGLIADKVLDHMCREALDVYAISQGLTYQDQKDRIYHNYVSMTEIIEDYSNGIEPRRQYGSPGSWNGLFNCYNSPDSTYCDVNRLGERP